MADYYTQFSTALVVDSPEQVKWVDALCTCVNALVLSDYSTENHDFNEKGEPKTAMGKLACEVYDGSEAQVFCTWVVRETEVWFEAFEENGDPHLVGRIVQAYYKHFKKDPEECFAFEWANTCSKPQHDAFGGGLLIANCDEVVSMSTIDWVEEQLRKMRGRVKRKAEPR